jgi:hypothetical protein
VGAVVSRRSKFFFFYTTWDWMAILFNEAENSCDDRDRIGWHDECAVTAVRYLALNDHDFCFSFVDRVRVNFP